LNGAIEGDTRDLLRHHAEVGDDLAGQAWEPESKFSQSAAGPASTLSVEVF
jgi:hypothetical protein